MPRGKYELNGVVAPLWKHAATAGLNVHTVRSRLKKGVSLRAALEAPALTVEARSVLSRKVMARLNSALTSDGRSLRQQQAAQSRYSNPDVYPPAALSAADFEEYRYLTRRKQLRMDEALRVLGRADLLEKTLDNEPN